MRLILHIGQYKTGSTSIQRSLARAAQTLAAQGVLYPRTGRDGGDNHGPLVAALRRAIRGGPDFDPAALQAEVAASGCDTVILSCEGFSGARLDRMMPGQVAAILRLAGTTLLPGAAVQLIWYWRRQDDAVESRIVQMIKGRSAGTDLSSQPYLRHGEALDYAFFARTVREALPQAVITARGMGPGMLAGGEVVQDFLGAAGLGAVLAPAQILRSNQTPPGRQLALQRALNRMAAAGCDVSAAQDALRRAHPGAAAGVVGMGSDAGKGQNGAGRAVILTAAERRRIMDFFAEANARFVTDVLPEAERAAAAAWLAAPVRDSVPNLAADAMDLAALLAGVAEQGTGQGAAAAAGARPDGAPPSQAPAKAAEGDALRLYLGAHKTASTHLQDLLVHHREALARRGVLVAAPGDLRGPDGWLETFFRAVHRQNRGEAPDPAARTQLRAPAVPGSDLVLTDENILGTAREALSAHAFYRYAPPRLRLLAELFADRRIQVFLSLRSYDGFIASMYAELVRNGGWLPFAEYRAALDQGDWGWPATVADLVAAFGEANVVLWDFADFPALLPDLVRLMTGGADPVPLIAGFAPEATRPSLSQTTLDLLAQLTPALGTEAAHALTEQLNGHYALAAGAPRFQPYSADDQALLQARYAADVAAIRSRWPGIRFLDPGAAAEAPDGKSNGEGGG